MQGWSEQVSGLWELVEAIGGRFALVEVVDSAALDVTNGSSACAADGCLMV